MVDPKVFHTARSLLGKNGENWVNHQPEHATSQQCLVTAILAACDAAKVDATKVNEHRRFVHDIVLGLTSEQTLANWNDSHTQPGPILEVLMKAEELATLKVLDA